MGVTLTPIFEFWPALKASDRTRYQETYFYLDFLFGLCSLLV